MTSDKEIAPPRVLIFWGPNGSGKSTVSTAIIENPKLFAGEYINADVIAKSLESTIPDYLTRNMEAANIAEQRRLTAIKEHRSLAFETVGSTPEKVALMTQAKETGYEVTLVFVTTKDPEINVQRVLSRVVEGGHSVEPKAIRDRYEKTMSLLSVAVDHADYAKIYDNSEKEPVLVAAKDKSDLSLHNPAQHASWVNDRLVKPFIERMESREKLSDIFDNQRTSASNLKDANASNGKVYSGEILEITKHHALQKTEDGNYLIHDLSLIASTDVKIGQDTKIEYAYKHGKITPIYNHKINSESIGEKMVPTEYASAVTKLGGQGATTIELPQAHTNYAGKVIQVSDTHIVQRIDEGRAVAHDVSKLTNRQEILTMARAGAVNGKHFDFKYSEKQGIASVSLVQPVKSSPVAIAAAPARVAPTNDLKR